MALVWITGLAGSGKTTVAGAILARMADTARRCVLLDGDTFRQEFAPELGYDRSSRLRCAERLTRHAATLRAHNDLVLVATISLFNQIHALNRRLHEPYLEVLLEADAPILAGRRPAEQRPAGPWVGEALAPEFPSAPHLVLRNHDEPDLRTNVDRIVAELERMHVL